jgi:uncharacterized protein
MSNHNLNLPNDIAHYSFWKSIVVLPFVKSLYLLGSRARGDARAKSDIDIAVNCPKASFQQWEQVLDIIDDADTLLGIDIVQYDELSDAVFKRKIDESKAVIYENGSA